ncbi:membrane-associated, eicosanoid/glutathione metabolism protein [Phaeosphaeria sp. MPI-PUGE-AT-0046c]|nr:membrane-associated, eicosanoid/glutathione metabolism protein [Phaeosphaeria sp. MPI-PUGE-AT-0046c]
MSVSTLNYHLLAIPAYYIFSVVPHAYASGLLANAGYKVNNASPKASLSPNAVKGKVPDAVFGKYQRAEAAQSNNFEQMPIFAVAVLASLFAERSTATGLGRAVANGDATGLTTFIGAWFAVRTMYVVAYVSISEHSKSPIRSLLWVTGTVLAFYQIYKAAALLG